ncbi:hypothetical protein AKJ36_02100 [candidate division MSBL1 archaeon SCGC-AAA259I07]|uniref:DUF8049 domain-containing protein n=1 Tax=candidate division MSBL1 archaeon SCGC-AAA259I07 TaxID=1698266 RepID=A0A133UL64_9EURY|nr:hypothetical protein AKJ36_02100 [candidate division MSBL1 archaeon SCGC-AAA259I07]
MEISDEVKVSLVTAVCVLALAIISKNILQVELDFITQYGPVWLFITYIITRGKEKSSGKPLIWSATIIIVTIAILFLYSF